MIRMIDLENVCMYVCMYIFLIIGDGLLYYARAIIVPFKFECNQLLNFIEKLSPLPGFEPGTSPVPSYQLRYPGLDQKKLFEEHDH